MRTRSLFGVGITAIIALIAGTVIYLNSPQSSPAPELSTATESMKPAVSASGTEGSLKTVTTPPRLHNGRLSPEAKSTEEFSSNPKREPGEQAVLEIAAERGVSDTNKVERLLAMVPTLSPDAKTLAVEHAAALIPDKDYLKYRDRLLKVADSAEMRIAIMDDSLTRGEELRLPNLLELMRSSKSDEEKQEIREIFEAYLDKDYGPNPAHWEAPLREWVAQHSDS
ncbi:MAG TPA: hypothetical protein VFG14_12760 [Chthoniobacteraceae bacterium]|jgi:hypothetical protein|nr:hypothetical protein [Chthoniobacteraceae bacterium]